MFNVCMRYTLNTLRSYIECEMSLKLYLTTSFDIINTINIKDILHVLISSPMFY